MDQMGKGDCSKRTKNVLLEVGMGYEDGIAAQQGGDSSGRQVRPCCPRKTKLATRYHFPHSMR